MPRRLATTCIFTKPKIDLGLHLQMVTAMGRLLATRGAAKRVCITHRIALSGIADFGDEVKDWFRQAAA